MATVTYHMRSGTEFTVNTWTDGDQLLPAVTRLSNGGFAVAYNDADSGTNRVLVDFYNASGAWLTLALPYSSIGATNVAGISSITQLTNGNVVVAWDDDHPTTPGLVAAIFDANGLLVTPEFNMTSFTGDHVPQITALAGGGFAVVNQYEGEIWLELFNSAGVSTVSEWLFVQVSDPNSAPVIAGLSDGRFVVVWERAGAQAGTTDVISSIVEADGDFVSSSYVNYIGLNSDPAVVGLANGGFAVAHVTDVYEEGENDIAVTFFDASNNRVRDVVVWYDDANESQPSITMLENGFIVVSYTWPYDANDNDVHYAILDQDGDRVTVDGVDTWIFSETTGHDQNSVVAGLLGGRFLGVWQDADSDGSGGRIRGEVNELYRRTMGDGTNETLAGDALADEMFGMGGDDTITGGGGNDIINGGAGLDSMNGGAGDDLIIVERGDTFDAETIQGDLGADTLRLVNNASGLASFGVNFSGIERLELVTSTADGVLANLNLSAPANFHITGSSGADEVRATFNGVVNLSGWQFGNWSANDVIRFFGTGGSVNITGTSQNDNISNTVGTDTLNGMGGNDILSGGEMNDALNGGDGNDILNGGAGADTLDGGNGADIADYSGATAGVAASLTMGGSNGEAAGDTYIAIENLRGSSFNDVLSGNGSANTLYGDVGDDTLNGGDGNDILNGGDGTDTLNGGADIDSLNGDGGDDTLYGGDGNDILSGGGGTDALNGGANNDSLNGSVGDDTLSGDAGNDILNGGAGADVLNGGDGNDIADYSGASARVIATLSDGLIEGDAVGDTYVSIEGLRGSSFDDMLSGANVAETLRGEGGADMIWGLGGNDTILGGDGNDTIFGGAGADTIGGGSGFDILSYGHSTAGVTVNLELGVGTGGDAQGDTLVSIEQLYGSEHDDNLVGGDFFADVLVGLGGNDVITGRYGGDQMHGGDGYDFMDFTNSTTGVDVRLFNGFAAGGEANGDTHSGFEGIYGSYTATDTLAGDDGMNHLFGYGGNETMTGRGGNDHLFGGDGNDTVLGGAGEDTLYGSVGNDTLGGGADDDLANYADSTAGVTVNLATGVGSGGWAQGDTFVSIEDVIGSAFNDVIIGKANFWDNVFDGAGGDDTLTGGNGSDTFVFRLGDGSDIVTDFAAGAASGDAIRMTGWGANFDTFAEVLAAGSQNGADVVFDFGNGQTLTLQNVTLGNLNAGDFLFAA